MTVKRVEVLAYAKINLMLDIIRRRTDGYHDLFMIMQSVGVAAVSYTHLTLPTTERV